jgi:O-antigen/teichoic acid export membrane protein
MVKRTVFLVASMFLSRAIAFLITPLYYKQLSLNEVAELEVLGVVAALAALIMGLELNQAIARFFPAEKNDDLFRRRYFDLLRIIMLMILAVTGATFMLVIVNHQVSYKHLIAVFSGGIALAFVSSFQSFLRSTFQDISLISFNFIFALLVLLINITLYQFNLLSPITFIVIPAIVAILSSLCILRPTQSELFRLSLSDAVCTSEYIKYSLPLLLVAVINFTFFYADRAYLIKSLNDYYLALYSLGIKITSITSFIFIAAGIIITPRIMRAGEGAYSFDLIKKAVYITTLVIFFGSVLSEIFANLIVIAISTTEYLELSNYMVCFISIATLGCSYVFMPGIDFKKKTYLHLMPILLGICTFVLILSVKAITDIADIIFAKLISVYFVFVMQYLLSARYTPPSLQLLLFNTALFFYSIFKVI